MSIFKKLFGKPTVTKEEQHNREKFTYEFAMNMGQYIQLSSVEETKDMFNPSHELWNRYADLYKQWLTIESGWDRRTLLYKFFDTIVTLEDEWEIAERFLVDRYADKALPFVEKGLANLEGKDEFVRSQTYTTASRVYLALRNTDKALEMGEKAVAELKNHNAAWAAYADALHCKSKHHEAHEIYNRLLNQNVESGITSTRIEFILGTWGAVNSPIFAFEFLTDYDLTHGLWEWASTEYYYSPQFRMEHAFRLLKSGEQSKAIVKTLVLSQEMPWYKDAVLNAHNMLIQSGLSQKMENEVVRLEKIIKDNNWSLSDLKYSRNIDE
ncbi:hypothetical protein QQ054_17500 [Oscillatoria amoena NRMC-F 0135]|nr:hypothetical protein [Oscillatoria amoena NRMC-F 0135]